MKILKSEFCGMPNLSCFGYLFLSFALEGSDCCGSVVAWLELSTGCQWSSLVSENEIGNELEACGKQEVSAAAVVVLCVGKRVLLEKHKQTVKM